MTDPHEGPQANTATPRDSEPTLTVYRTAPDSITQHIIFDHELTSLTNVSRPITLALASAAFGAFWSLLPGTIDFISHINDKVADIPISAKVAAPLDATFLVTTMIFGYFAGQGIHDARKVKAEIGRRNKRSVQ